MKCFIVVNQLNNPIFLDFDAEFTNFIRKKAGEAGLQDPNQLSGSNEVDTAVVTQLFSPLVLSQVPLDDQVQNPCTSVHCPSGLLLVFKKIDEIQYIAISGDGKEKEDFLQRKILMFIRLTKFLFGPVFSEIANLSPVERSARWKFVKGLLYTWTNLTASQQMFLVEALERLHVNQVVSEKCVSLLEKIVHKLQIFSDQLTQHAFLLVSNKLLALYSKRSTLELHAADILLMTILVQGMFPSKDLLEELLASNPTFSSLRRHIVTSLKAKEANSSADKEEKNDENEEFHSAPTTPSQKSPTPGKEEDEDITDISATQKFSDDPTSAVKTIKKVMKYETSEVKQQNGTDAERSDAGGEGDDGCLERLMTAGESGRTLVSKNENDTSSSNVETNYPPLSAPEAAKGRTALFSSGLLFAQQLLLEAGHQDCNSEIDERLDPGTREMTGQAAADPLCQVLNIIQDVLYGRRNKLSRTKSLHVHEVIAELLRKIHGVAKKTKKQSLQNSSGAVLSRWENEMKDKLISYLQMDEHLPMQPDLESSLVEFRRRLKELFQQFYMEQGFLGGREMVADLSKDLLSPMKVKLQQELLDYLDYLNVKAQRNITMTSYLDDFPGLIHFIYVDRQFQQMSAPSFNMLNHGIADGSMFLKEKVWKMYGYMMKKLQQGYTSVLLRDGDFYYSLFLWFEDSTGNPVAVQEPYKPEMETFLPGTLTGSFYKRLVRQCFPNRVDGAIHCYEMFLMHIGLVTPLYIATHCRKLAQKLWELSGEAYTPVGLL